MYEFQICPKVCVAVMVHSSYMTFWTTKRNSPCFYITDESTIETFEGEEWSDDGSNTSPLDDKYYQAIGNIRGKLKTKKGCDESIGWVK